MGPKQIIGRLKRKDGIAYTFGRFLTVRRVYSILKRVTQMGQTPEPATVPTLFAHANPDEAVSSLRRDAVSTGISLPATAVEEIYRFALENPISHVNIEKPFRYSDVTHGKLPDGQAVATASVKNPLACPVIAQLVDDPLMRQIASRYLGYRPPRADVVLYWSFTADLGVEERRRFNQTVDYHIDVHDFNFCYAHFYITPCDERSGAHVMVRGSHVNKRLSWLFGAASRSDAEIAKYYPSDDLLVLKGPAGTGFIEDTSCYHKALAPTENDRLLLQIRYH